MSIFDRISADLKSARLGRRPAEVLTLATIVGDLSSNAKMVDGKKVVADADVVAYLKKFISSLDVMIAARPDDAHQIWERELVSTYLPQQLTEQQLVDLVWGRHLSLGDYMSFLKTNYAGQYDGKLASQVWKGCTGE